MKHLGGDVGDNSVCWWGGLSRFGSRRAYVRCYPDFYGVYWIVGSSDRTSAILFSRRDRATVSSLRLKDHKRFLSVP